MRSILSLVLVMLIACTSVQAQQYKHGTKSLCTSGKLRATGAWTVKVRSARLDKSREFIRTSSQLIPWQGNTPRRRARRQARRLNRLTR